MTWAGRRAPRTFQGTSPSTRPCGSNGRRIDLGTLGGPNSGVIRPVKNDRGMISGIAETDGADPLGERWSCSAFFPSRAGKTCRGVVWERGAIRALPTLGGSNGFATGSNNRRQVVGWTETTLHDPTCVPPQVLQFRPVIWGPGRDQIEMLPSLPGDSVGSATAINDRSQVVGISGICEGRREVQRRSRSALGK